MEFTVKTLTPKIDELLPNRSIISIGVKSARLNLSFNPQKFLSRVNLDKLIEHNEAYNENKVVQGTTPCILCSSKQGPGLLLNDKSYLCKKCFSEVSTISYPEKYEENRRNHIKAKESRRIALEEFTKKYGYTKEGTSVTVFAWLSLVLLFVHIGLIVVPVILFLVSSSIEKEQEKKLQIWNKQRTKWENIKIVKDKDIIDEFWTKC